MPITIVTESSDTLINFQNISAELKLPGHRAGELALSGPA